MEQHVYVAMFGPMPQHPTGLAMSVLRRAQAFARAGISTDILIDTFYPDYDGHTSRLQDSGRLGDLITLRSLHQDLAGQATYPVDVRNESPISSGDDWQYEPDKERVNVRRGYEAGEYRHFVWERPDGTVNFIDHISAKRRVRREWYDVAGKPCKVELMNAQNKPEVIRYMRRDGSCYMEELLDASTNRVRGIVVHRAGEPSLFFSDGVELFAYWMQSFVLNDELTAPTIISEYGVRRRALTKLEVENNARVIYTVHSNHLSAPHAYGSPIRGDMRDFIEHIPDYKDVVVLTEEQRQDLWKLLGYNDSIHVIPHHMPPAEGVGPRDPKRVVMVGRFDPIKGQIPALEAFRKVLQVMPDVRLDLYGRGKDEEKVRAAVIDLDLEGAVAVRGFTNDPAQTFSEAAVSIVASEYEGFCLSMAESMAAGCVPVCYDFKYGPRDIVRHGVDGLLVEKGNIQDLADSIVLLLRNDGLRERMSDAATAIADRLSEQRLVKDWQEVLAR